MSEEKEVFTIREAAEYLKVHPQTIRRWVKLGKLQRLGRDRSVRIRKSDLHNGKVGTNP